MATPVKEPKTAVRRPDESLLKRLTRHQLLGLVQGLHGVSGLPF